MRPFSFPYPFLIYIASRAICSISKYTLANIATVLPTITSNDNRSIAFRLILLATTLQTLPTRQPRQSPRAAIQIMNPHHQRSSRFPYSYVRSLSPIKPKIPSPPSPHFAQANAPRSLPPNSSFQLPFTSRNMPILSPIISRLPFPLFLSFALTDSCSSARGKCSPGVPCV